MEMKSSKSLTKYISRNIDVLLVHLPTRDTSQPSLHEIEYWDAMGKVGQLMGDQPAEPPLGLLSIAASLEAKGIQVRFIDLNLMDVTLRNSGKYMSLSYIGEVVSNVKPRFIGISAMTVQENWLIAVASTTKELHPDAEIVVGGIHPTFQAKPLLEKCAAIDVVVQGEGETTMLELVQGKPKEEILGITFRAENGDLITTPPRPLLTPDQLGILPFPAYNLLASEAFPLVPRILSTRGCTGQCKFCVVNKFFKNRLRRRDPARVVDEIEWLLCHFDIGKSLESNVPFTVIGDLTFGATPSSMEICNEIIARGIKVNWWCQTRADIITERKIDMERMYEAGCRHIAIGIESASEEQLQESDKGITPHQSVKACQQAKNAGMLVQGYFVIGLPGETVTSAYKTIQFMDNLMQEGLIDLTHISMAVLYPGTPMFAEPEKYGYTLVSRDFEQYRMGAGEFDGGLPPYETAHLSRYEIYALWERALCVAAGNYRMKAEQQIRKEMGSGISK